MGCFVNEDSICPKNPTRFPGIFSSTLPCEDPRAPKPRGGWLGTGCTVGAIAGLDAVGCAVGAAVDLVLWFSG